MKRLTRKITKILPPHFDQSAKYESNIDEGECTSFIPVFNKLGEIEDIEEELGIDLIVLFKALKSGVWYKDRSGQICHDYVSLADNSISHRYKLAGLYLRGETYSYLFEQYGKYWTLAREEMER